MQRASLRAEDNDGRSSQLGPAGHYPNTGCRRLVDRSGTPTDAEVALAFSPMFFWKRQVEARDQVERIAKDLSYHPEIVRANFGQEATWGEVHAVVLNASFLSFPRSRSGTFFYDASALSRFLKEGTLNEIHSHPHEDGRIDVSVEVVRLWDGEHPAPSDLLREMENPGQVKMERDKYYIARKLLSLSVSSALMLEEAASKPPDFEPL